MGDGTVDPTSDLSEYVSRDQVGSIDYSAVTRATVRPIQLSELSETTTRRFNGMLLNLMWIMLEYLKG
jgi:hypothetical protein